MEKTKKGTVGTITLKKAATIFDANPKRNHDEKGGKTEHRKREDEGESECERIHTQQTSREKGDDQLGRKQGT